MSAGSPPSFGLFVTATGTDCGKTWLTRGLARALTLRGHRVAALKPIETGVRGEPLDAVALAAAAKDPSLAHLPGLVRLSPPLAPAAAVTASDPPLPSIAALAHTVLEHARAHDVLLVEGAGGLLVPYDEAHTVADLAASLALPLVLVARDALGTLSHALTAYESAERRGLVVRALVLTHGPWSRDPSIESNARLLAERLPAPVVALPACPDDDDALSRAAGPLLEFLLPSLAHAPGPQDS